MFFDLNGIRLGLPLVPVPPPRGLRGWWQRALRGATDWDAPRGYVASAAEQRAPRMRRSEPWFLDRAKFDQLFPLDASRYRKRT